MFIRARESVFSNRKFVKNVCIFLVDYTMVVKQC